jgi:S1-C subfamily serine protease
MQSRLYHIASILQASFILFFSPSSAQDLSVLTRLEQDLRRLVERVKPSVVTVSARQIGLVPASESELVSFDVNPQGFYEVINIGTGILLDSTHILTHSSVVQNSDSIEITFNNDKHSPGQIVGHDPETGLTVLQVPSVSLRPAPLRLGERLVPGCTVALIGNSLGVSPAISLGIVNGVRNDGLIQVSTNVTAGNAGSPLFDSQGRLAGILAGRLSPVGDDYVLNEGLALSEAAVAFPADEIMQRARQIINHTPGERGWMGVSAEDWPGGMGWVHLNDVKPNSPAQQAGLRVGDILVNMNDRPIKGSRFLAQYIRQSKPGDKIAFGVLRGDSTFSVQVTTMGSQDAFPGSPLHKRVYSSAVFTYGEQTPSRYVPIPQSVILQRINSLEQELNHLRSMLNKPAKQ